MIYKRTFKPKQIKINGCIKMNIVEFTGFVFFINVLLLFKWPEKYERPFISNDFMIKKEMLLPFYDIESKEISPSCRAVNFSALLSKDMTTAHNRNSPYTIIRILVRIIYHNITAIYLKFLAKNPIYTGKL